MPSAASVHRRRRGTGEEVSRRIGVRQSSHMLMIDTTSNLHRIHCVKE